MKRNGLRSWGSHKRRLVVVAVVALVVAVIAPLLAPSAGAVVGNPGTLDVSMRLSVFTPSFTIAGVASNGTGNATLRKSGLVKIPKSSLSFLPINVQIDLPTPTTTTTATTTTTTTASSTTLDPSSTTTTTTTTPPPGPSVSTVSVQTVATSDFTGGINPKNGAGFLVGNIEEIFSQSSSLSGCVVGPFRVQAGTSTAGGVAYSQDNGTVTVVDPNFEIDAIPPAASGCGGLEGAINAALSLPVTTTTTTTTSTIPGQSPNPTSTTVPSTIPPVPAVVVTLTFSPAPHAETPHPKVGRRGPGTTNATGTAAVSPNTGFGNTPDTNQVPGVHHHKPVRHPKKEHKKSKKKHHPKVDKAANSKADKTKKAKRHKKSKKGVYFGTNAGRTVTPAAAPAAPAAHPAKNAGGAGAASRQLTFVTASFVKPSPSALSTGLNLLGLLGLLVFSSLALWLVTTEVSAFSANARRQRSHRIAGVTRDR